MMTSEHQLTESGEFLLLPHLVPPPKPSSRWTISSHVLIRELAGEAVLLDAESGNYFGLNELGTRIWNLLAQHGQLAPVFETLLLEYEVEPHRLQGDLDQFVSELAARGLLRRL